MTNAPKVGDVVLYYGDSHGNAIRQPVSATVKAVYELSNVSWARPRMMEYNNAVDLVYFEGTSLVTPKAVPYVGDINPVVGEVYWAWPL